MAGSKIRAVAKTKARRELYFRRLDAELARLQAEGVRPNAAGVRWLSAKVDASRDRARGPVR